MPVLALFCVCTETFVGVDTFVRVNTKQFQALPPLSSSQVTSRTKYLVRCMEHNMAPRAHVIIRKTYTTQVRRDATLRIEFLVASVYTIKIATKPGAIR